MDVRRDCVSYVQDERYAAGAGMRRSGVFQFCTESFYLRGRQGGAVSYFRTCREPIHGGAFSTSCLVRS